MTYRQQFYNNAVAAVFLPTGTNFLAIRWVACHPSNILSGAVPTPPQETTIISPDYRDPYGWQSSIGFQKQLGPLMAFDVDFTSLEERNMVRSRDVNLFYDPVTGYSKDPTLFGRPNPAYGLNQWLTSDGKTESRMISTSFTAALQQQLPGERHLHASPVDEGRHDGLRLSGGQPVRSGCRLGAVDRLPEAHLPLQRHRPAAVAVLGVGLVLLRIGRALQPEQLDAAVQQARHEPLEHRRADHDSRGGASIAGKDRR